MEITNRIKDKVTDCLFFELKERRVSQAEFARIIALRHGIKFDKSVLSQIKYEKERNYSVIKDTSWLVLARHYRCMEDNAWGDGGHEGFYYGADAFGEMPGVRDMAGAL